MNIAPEEMPRELERLLEENERLNNVINEIEKYCNEEIEGYDKAISSKILSEIGRNKYEAEKMCYLDILDKIKKLKGGDKE